MYYTPYLVILMGEHDVNEKIASELKVIKLGRIWLVFSIRQIEKIQKILNGNTNGFFGIYLRN